jgi:hypothetical protein
MAYFAGLGAGKGWLKILFLVEPDVLQGILLAVQPRLVIMNRQVLADYTSTPITKYVQAYARYLDAMLESPEAASAASMSVYTGLAHSRQKLTTVPCRDPKYKRMETNEPVVNLGPEMLHYDAVRGQVCTGVLSNLYFGAELSFPRVISLEREKCEILHDTSRFPSFGIFESLKTHLQEVTRPCKLRSPVREHRTVIRITEQMRVKMRKHPGLRKAKLEIL